MDNRSKDGFPDDHLAEIFSRVPSKWSILGGVRIGGLAASQPRGVDVSQGEDTLRWRPIAGRSSDHNSSSVHHLKMIIMKINITLLSDNFPPASLLP